MGTLLERDHLRSHPCTHAGLFANHPRIELVAGCDLDPERRALFATDWGLPSARVFGNYRDLLEEVRPEIVAIATWTDSHAAIAIDAARAGVRVVLCEKPMAISLAEADRMIEVCRAEGVLLTVHHERRWTRSYRTCRGLIAAGAIGEVRTIVGSVLTGEPRQAVCRSMTDWHAISSISGGGPTLHDGTHLFDAIRFLCGPVSSIEGETEWRDVEGGVEHTGRAILRLESGAVGFVECGGRRGYFHFEIDIQGSKGRIRIGNAEQRLWSVGPSPRYEDFIEFSEQAFPLIGEPDYFPHIVDELIEAVETGKPSVSSGEDGRAALGDVLAVYAGRRFVRPTGAGASPTPDLNLPRGA